MAFQTVFKRYELKYMLTLEQKQKVLAAMAPYMKLDNYGRTTIRNIYYDTDTYLLVRRSIEKPAYKEKLRIRSYSQAEPDSTVFVELKKKYKHVVYKRRISLPEEEAILEQLQQETTETEEVSESDVEEPFYEDDVYVYIFGNPQSDYTIVKYSDGTTEALSSGEISIKL